MPTISASRLDFLIDSDAKRIGFMAGVLQISEYEFFRIAHQNWFDRPVSEKRLESLFVDYLTTGEAPFWVNDFARKTHEKFKACELDYRDYGIVRRVIDRRTKIIGWIIIICLTILISIYSYVISRYIPYY